MLWAMTRLHRSLVIGRGLGGGGYFIVMEHLNFEGRASQEELGRGLAQMHLAEPRVSARTQMQALVLELARIMLGSIMPGCLAHLVWGGRLLI